MSSILSIMFSVFPTWFSVILLVLFALALIILLIRVIGAIIDAIPFL